MEKGVEGRYVSIEQLKELENGSTQWLMVTAGSAGGMIPGFLVEASMDSKIAEVGQFLIWFVVLTSLAGCSPLHSLVAIEAEAERFCSSTR